MEEGGGRGRGEGRDRASMMCSLSNWGRGRISTITNGNFFPLIKSAEEGGEEGGGRREDEKKANSRGRGK